MENFTTIFTTIGYVDNSSRDLNDTENVDHDRNSLAFVHFVFGTYTLVSNSLVILAVLRFHYLQERANMYIVSLAGTDCCVGAVELVVGFHSHSILSAWFDRTRPACVGMFSFVFFAISCSMFNMVLIALDRWLYIMKPFYYTRAMTPMRVKMAIGIVWLLSLFWGIVPLCSHTYNEANSRCTMQTAIPSWYRAYSNVPVLFTGAMITGVVYIIITLKAMEHKKAIYGKIPSFVHARNRIGYMSDAGKATVLSLRSNIKTLKRFCILFLLLVVCWFPYYIIEFTSEFVSIPDFYYRASVALGFLNSGINAVVYAMYYQKFRNAMRQMVCPCCSYDQVNRDFEYITTTGNVPEVSFTQRTSASVLNPEFDGIGPSAPSDTSRDTGQQVDKTELQAASSPAAGPAPQNQSPTPEGPEKAAIRSSFIDWQTDPCIPIPKAKRPSAGQPHLSTRKHADTQHNSQSSSTETSSSSCDEIR